MGSGGVAIAALPTVICLEVPFSDGLGGGEMSGYLFRYSLGDIPMILLKYLPNTDWEGKFRVSLIC